MPTKRKPQSTGPNRGGLHVIKGKRDGDALMARRRLVVCFLQAVRALPPGWNYGEDPTPKECSTADYTECSSADYAISVIYSLALWAAKSDDPVFTDDQDYRATVMEASLPNRRRYDLRHLAALRKSATESASRYADFAKEIGVDPSARPPIGLEAAGAATWSSRAQVRT